MHVFHIHQIHFLAVAVNGMPLVEPIFRDVLEIPTWSGRASDPYPNMTILLDFRSPLIVGQFPYHCHILGHEDKGMMAKIEVLPGKQAVAVTNAPQVSSTVTNSNSNSLFLVVVTVLPICGCIILGLLAYILYSRIEVVKTVDKKKYHYSQKDENHFTSIDKSHESSNDLESANASDCFTESGLKTDRIVDLTMNIDGSKRSVALSTTRDDTWTEVGNDTVPTAATTSNHSVLVEYEMVNRSVSRSQLTASLDYAHFGINGGEVPNVYEE